MNIEHYKNFIKIADLGNISNAAKTLLIAQPSLSKQIKMLEQEFGAPLLKRNARNVELTPAGEIFYEKARLICELNDSCHDEINSNILGSRGMLRIGLTISYPDPFAEDLLRDFSEQYPDINYDIREASSVQLLNLVKNNIIEIALIRKPLYVNPIFKLFNGIEENFMAVYHKNNPWIPADTETVPIQMLRGVPLSISYGLRERIEQMFNEAGFEPLILSVNSSRITTLMWTHFNKAVGIVTTNNFRNLETAPTAVCRPITGVNTKVQRPFAVLKNANLSSVARTFLDFISTRTAL